VGLAAWGLVRGMMGLEGHQQGGKKHHMFDESVRESSQYHRRLLNAFSSFFESSTGKAYIMITIDIFGSISTMNNSV
jgi:hypothetical protein